MSEAVPVDIGRALSKEAGEETPEEFLRRVVGSELDVAVLAAERQSQVYDSLRALDEVIRTQYGDRALVELIQNAHDAHSAADRGEIEIRLDVRSGTEAELFVANRGRGFTEENVQSLRNLARSNKEIGEGIGNKGLGFRSVEALTTDPRIFSQPEARRSPKFDGFCFRFLVAEEVEAALSARRCSDEVRRKVARAVPHYLMSVPITDQPAEVREFAEAGYATVVVLPLRSVQAVELAKKQVNSLLDGDAPLMLFLDRLEKVRISIRAGEERRSVDLRRRTEMLGQIDGLEGATYHRVDLGERGK